MMQDAREVNPEYRPRWLTPDVANIHLGNRGALHVTVLNDRIYGGVFAVRALPVRFPREYISLRHFDSEKKEQEVGLVRGIDDWPEEVRNLLAQALLRRYFVHVIEEIESIRLVFGHLTFRVRTDHGPGEFMMRWQADRAQDYGPRGKMILDVDENRYLVRDVSALPPKQAKVFRRHVYW